MCLYQWSFLQGLFVAILYCFLNQEVSRLRKSSHLTARWSGISNCNPSADRASLSGPEGGSHAVAEVAGEELWGGVTSSEGQPDGHTFLVKGPVQILHVITSRYTVKLEKWMCIHYFRYIIIKNNIVEVSELSYIKFKYIDRLAKLVPIPLYTA